MHSKQDIENAARLVPEHVFVSVGGIVCVDREHGPNTEWQPWADTEAGRSDALVLSRAVARWVGENRDIVFGGNDDLWAVTKHASRAWLRGTWQEWLDANMLSAAAILWAENQTLLAAQDGAGKKFYTAMGDVWRNLLERNKK